jgi:membrane-associated phospholipid phosphatase
MTTLLAPHEPLSRSGLLDQPALLLDRRLWLAAAFAALAAVALVVDLPVFQFCATGRISGDLRRLLTWSELFAHGLGVGILAVTILVLDPARRRQIPRLLALALGSGIVADLIKLAVARSRPKHFTGQAVADTFTGWLPGLWPVPGFERFDHRLQSFPSAHTAVAVSLAIGLSGMYPRGRYLFPLFALLSACQRIECSAHFVSDTFAGAAVGCLVSAALLGPTRLSTALERWELAS